MQPTKLTNILQRRNNPSLERPSNSFTLWEGLITWPVEVGRNAMSTELPVAFEDFGVFNFVNWDLDVVCYFGKEFREGEFPSEI